jgi:hypothetical protein
MPLKWKTCPASIIYDFIVASISQWAGLVRYAILRGVFIQTHTASLLGNAILQYNCNNFVHTKALSVVTFQRILLVHIIYSVPTRVIPL